MAQESDAPRCEEHKYRPAEKRCISCSRLLCADCAPATLDPPPEKGYGVCGKCQRRVRPWVWNRYAAGRDEDSGNHISEALRLRRAAMLRSGWGTIPWASVAPIVWLGCLGIAWLAVDVAATPDMPSFERFGLGIPWSLAGAAVVATFMLSLHTLQPPGKAPAATLQQTAQLTATAFVGPGLVWLLAGLVGLVSSGAFDGRLLVYAGLATVPVGLLWGVGVAGWGMAVRRGAHAATGVTMAAGALAMTSVLAGLVVFIWLNPPWLAWG